MHFTEHPRYIDTRGTNIEIWYYCNDPFNSGPYIVQNPNHNIHFVSPTPPHFELVWLELDSIEKFYSLGEGKEGLGGSPLGAIAGYVIINEKGSPTLIRGPMDSKSEYGGFHKKKGFIKDLEKRLGFKLNQKTLSNNGILDTLYKDSQSHIKI